MKPYPVPRPRCACRGKFGAVYHEPKYKEWQAAAVEKLKEIGSFEDFSDVFERPVRITMEVISARPKTTKKFAPRGDNDNYEKGVWDAITKTQMWWKDDDQIVDNRTIKRWAEPDEPEGYQIRIEYL